MTPSRRQLITNLIAFTAAAPAIVRAASLMPVKSLERITLNGVPLTFDGGFAGYQAVVRRAFVPRLFVQLYDYNPILACIQNLSEDT